MPPRYAYWTILIDGKATAFRAREREELEPSYGQLARKNTDIAMRYFARGKLWDSPEQAQWASRSLPPAAESRGRDWRPGGAHKDPRARFKKSEGPKGAPRSAARPAGHETSGRRLPEVAKVPTAKPQRSWRNGQAVDRTPSQTGSGAQAREATSRDWLGKPPAGAPKAFAAPSPKSATRWTGERRARKPAAPPTRPPTRQR